MKKQIIAAILSAVLVVLSLSSCSKLEIKDDVTETSGETEYISETTEEPATVNLEEEALTEPSSEESTTEISTESTTAAKITEKVSKISTTVATTVAKTTAKVTTTKAKVTEGGTVTSTAPSEGTKNRYGVIVYTSSSGSTTVSRFWYTGTYDELLPEAKKNRKTYASYINQILALTNEMRAEKNLPALKLSEKLTEQACVRAEEIAWSGKHSHYRPDGTFFSELFKINGFTKGNAGENIGWGYDTPSAVSEAWKNSETHYANILDERFTTIGIGVAADADPSGKLCWVQHFYSESVD